MANWDLEKVQRFAPDQLTFERSERLLTPTRWKSLGQKGGLIWGECRTSGVTWYKTAMELDKVRAFSNSPATEYPDKYILALLRLYIKSPERFKDMSTPLPWVSEGFRREAQKRSLSPEHKASKQEESRQRNRRKRLALMHKGVVDLEQWLEDVVREGLGAWQQRSDASWEAIASRMTDQKLGGLARRLRYMADNRWNNDWLDRLTQELADLFLFTQAFQQIDDWDEEMQANLMQWAGVHFRKEQIAELSPQSDYWLTMGIEEGEDENLRFRKTWLWGEKSQAPAYILEFAWGNIAFEHDFKVGAAYEADLIFYPGVPKFRALAKKVIHQQRVFSKITGHKLVQEFLRKAAKQWAENPWIKDLPAMLLEVYPVFSPQHNQIILVDQSGQHLPVMMGDAGWKWLATYTGQPMLVFGKWDGLAFVPFTTLSNQRIIRLFYA